MEFESKLSVWLLDSDIDARIVEPATSLAERSGTECSWDSIRRVVILGARKR